MECVAIGDTGGMTALSAWEPTFATLGDRMQFAMRQARRTSSQMAIYMGVGRSAVSEWINGKSKPKLHTLRAWAEGTGVPLEWLCAGDPELQAAFDEVRRQGLEPRTRWLRVDGQVDGSLMPRAAA